MYSIASSYLHLSILANDDTVFVWSKKSKNLYSFAGCYGALFLFMEEIKSEIPSLERSFEKIALPNSALTQDIYNKIKLLLQDREPFYKEELYKPLAIPSLKEREELFGSLACYYAYGSCFILDIDSRIESIKKYFEHLLIPSQLNCNSCKYIFKLQYVSDQYYSLYINTQKIEDALEEANILSVLQDYIRITLYEKSDFCFAFHAASFQYKRKTLLFPAVSGAGKSTLSAFLMLQTDFLFYSDEVAAIDSAYRMQPLPFCLTIKEGSWDILHRLFAEIESAEIYRRLDKQKIKFLRPRHIAKEGMDAQEAYMIFPEYKRGSKLLLDPLSMVEAIALLIDSGYHLNQADDFSSVKNFLEYLEGLKIYKLLYSDLQEALDAIKEIVDE